MNDWPSDWFEQFWKLYPRRVAKKDAFRALSKVHREVEWDYLIEAVKAFANSVRGKDVQYIPHPATWINGGRWDDEIAKPADDTSWKLSRAMEETMRRRMQ